MSSPSLRAGKELVRKSFGAIKDIVPVPNLIEVQSKSFNDFAQLDFLPAEREHIGLEKVFRDIFPIEYGDKLSLEYVSYELGTWSCTCGSLEGIEQRYTWSCQACSATGCSRLPENRACPECQSCNAQYATCSQCLSRVRPQMPMSLSECRSSEQTLSMPLKVTVQLISWDKDNEGNKIVRDIKEQEIFFADVPVMADLYEENGRIKLGSLGTFLINGIDRVVVSQLHRSPGAVFSQSKRVKDTHGKPYYLARVIPMRGSWLDFEFDSNDHLYVRIDKKKKFFVTTLLQALGLKRSEIIPYFYASDSIVCRDGAFYREVDETVIGMRLKPDMADIPQDAPYIGRPITKDVITWLKEHGVTHLRIDPAVLVNRVFASDVLDPQTGEIVARQGEVFTTKHKALLGRFKELYISMVVSSGYVLQPTIPATLMQDKCTTQEEALKEIYTKVWPGDNASLKEIKERLESIFFNPRLYDLTRVGRIRINRKLGLSIDENTTTLTRDDIFATINYLVGLRERGEGELDDIDHLGNRRVRLVGELLANQMYVGMLRIDRIVRERFRLQEAQSSMTPQDFLNVKPLSAIIREFFGTGQLSQFMDQTNPLSEIAHKRRLSALGPGGIMKDRATYEVRDVHTSHYGRICPIETPEGQTIGLISSLATYATVNDLGFIETAYRGVSEKKITDDVVFLDAFEESSAYIAQADLIKQGNDMNVPETPIFARHGGNFLYARSNKINYIDLSPKQLVSVSTALIPFLEHDDATRALMGANMQRQAVPLIRTQVPLVGTGMESEIARASGACAMARRAGTVSYVSSDKIIVSADEEQFQTVNDWVASGIETYHLRKFERSSYDTWVHQRPCVQAGQRVAPGDMLSDSSAIADGELALGTNLLVAFMPWRGYNFEDAIVLSKRLVAEDTLTSVHIDEYDVEARDTKLGPEEITRDIPNTSESALAGLDEDGIVRVGTRVKAGDILVGKVTLKGDVQYSPEEKLLRAIFGEKSREVRDTSLRVPPGVEGTVVDIKVFSRSGVRKDKRYKEMVAQESARLAHEFSSHEKYLRNMIHGRVVDVIANDISAKKDELDAATLEELFGMKLASKEADQQVRSIQQAFENQQRILKAVHEERIAKLKKGDVMPSGVIKMVKVYIAKKRPIQVGDKMAGRHGNKGVVSLIVPREDMPHTDDGTPVDIVLNPLGVPSRMNVGQVLETVLGYAGSQLGKKMQSALNSASESALRSQLVDCYGEDFVTSYESSHGSDGLMELARTTARHGALYKTPVFDGADFERDIQPLLTKADAPTSGTFNLRDGRTGEYFDQAVTVGMIYMLKLNHMVDDKLHARSVGPYSLVTQQPLGGKAQMGGQRLGEMEVWALEAHGAAYTLQEMLTYKSDDVNGRNKVYEAVVRGEDVPEPGLPESFNVLIKELQSLGLRIDLFKSGKEEISG